MEKIYGMHRLVGLQLFLSGTPTFSSGTPTFCQMGVLNSCFQNPSESSVIACYDGVRSHINVFLKHKRVTVYFSMNVLKIRLAGHA